ncbi:CotY/CotZ family spore coat protein [Salimicrobium halophilum]|uniref:Spore coat protein Z n=1 Tax=Salimicrobium halophilum TaxID=86666 RepID=A0A1G8TUB8_9BACI|nr:CotY/CotZ family spore coat protein [Salimicrobium halophilum]SDJ45166.1 spore coat protein Z [Salimicrobium halophilum]
MGCGEKFDSKNCVSNILKEIVDAQSDVLHDCDSSCEQSISDLLGDTGATGLDTVPVLLYCEGTCKPFKGYGAKKTAIKDIMASFYFRVKSIDSHDCATLELLRDPHDTCEDPESPVKQFTKNLKATGICITVDVDCFCHITCLPAVEALS